MIANVIQAFRFIHDGCSLRWHGKNLKHIGYMLNIFAMPDGRTDAWRIGRFVLRWL